MIKVENVIKKYGKSQETLALKGINLEFPDKGLISILGPSGCGKSTLLNLLGLLDRPTEGDVLIDGISTKGLRGAKKDSLRNETIGFIFQSYHLIPTLSLINNVILPLEIDNKDKYNIAKEKGITLLKKFGFEERWETLVSEEEFLSCDYTKIPGILEEEKKKFMDYVINSLR